jgi:hypothetical protein
MTEHNQVVWGRRTPVGRRDHVMHLETLGAAADDAASVAQ